MDSETDLVDPGRPSYDPNKSAILTFMQKAMIYREASGLIHFAAVSGTAWSVFSEPRCKMKCLHPSFNRKLAARM
jgi:hypothetical protein